MAGTIDMITPLVNKRLVNVLKYWLLTFWVEGGTDMVAPLKELGNDDWCSKFWCNLSSLRTFPSQVKSSSVWGGSDEDDSSTQRIEEWWFKSKLSSLSFINFSSPGSFYRQTLCNLKYNWHLHSQRTCAPAVRGNLKTGVKPSWYRQTKGKIWNNTRTKRIWTSDRT